MASSGTNLKNNETYASYVDAIRTASYGVDVRDALTKAFDKIAEEIDSTTADHATAIDAAISNASTSASSADTVAGQLNAQMNPEVEGTLAWKINDLDSKISTTQGKANSITQLVDRLNSTTGDTDPVDSLIQAVSVMNYDISSFSESIDSRAKYKLLSTIESNGEDEISYTFDSWKNYDALFIVMKFHDAHSFYKVIEYGKLELPAAVARGTGKNRVTARPPITSNNQKPCTVEYADITTKKNGWHEYYGSVLVMDKMWSTGVVYAKGGLTASRAWKYDKTDGTLTSEAPIVLGKDSDDVPIDNLFEDGTTYASEPYSKGTPKNIKFFTSESSSVRTTVTVKDTTLKIEMYTLGNRAKRKHFAVPYLVYGVTGIRTSAPVETTKTTRYVVYNPNGGAIVSVEELKPLNTTYYVATEDWEKIQGNESSYFVHLDNNGNPRIYPFIGNV